MNFEIWKVHQWIILILAIFGLYNFIEDVILCAIDTRRNYKSRFGTKADNCTTDTTNVQEDSSELEGESIYAGVLIVPSVYSYLALCTAIIGFVFLFVFQFSTISGSSMEPTLHDGEFIIGNRLDKDYSRNEVIIFTTDYDGNQRLLIKRVIGIEGDTVECKNNTLFINGEEASGDYTALGITEDFSVQTVPKDCVFVLGDNREHSTDSRYEPLGMIPIKDIISTLNDKKR